MNNAERRACPKTETEAQGRACVVRGRMCFSIQRGPARQTNKQTDNQAIQQKQSTGILIRQAPGVCAAGSWVPVSGRRPRSGNKLKGCCTAQQIASGPANRRATGAEPQPGGSTRRMRLNPALRRFDASANLRFATGDPAANRPDPPQPASAFVQEEMNA